MEDWRYENLREDVRRLRGELYEVRGRTNRIESWQSLLPFRAWMAVVWLIIAGTWIAVIVDGTGVLNK